MIRRLELLDNRTTEHVVSIPIRALWRAADAIDSVARVVSTFGEGLNGYGHDLSDAYCKAIERAQDAEARAAEHRIAAHDDGLVRAAIHHFTGRSA